MTIGPGQYLVVILDNGAGIVPADWIAATRDGASYGQAYSTAFPGSYRNQFWIEDAQSRNLMCRGVFGQLIHVNFDARIVTVKLSTWPEFLNHPYSVATLRAVHAISGALE